MLKGKLERCEAIDILGMGNNKLTKRLKSAREDCNSRGGTLIFHFVLQEAYLAE